MDIMMLLEGGALTAVYDDFRTKLIETGDGLSMTEFVKTMFDNIPGIDKFDKGTTVECGGAWCSFLTLSLAAVKLVKDLCELFEQIDVNGDGAMEWEEFTGFCVEAGMVASRKSTSIAPFKYTYNRHFVDNVSHCSFIQHVSFCQKQQQVLVCEGEMPFLRVYNRHLRLQNTIRTTPEGTKGAFPLRAVLVASVRGLAVVAGSLGRLS